MAAGAVVAYGLCALAASDDLGPVWALKCICGLCVLVWLPGLPFAYMLVRGSRIRWLDLASASFLLGIAASIVLTTVAKAFVPRLTPNVYLGLTLGLSAIGLALARSQIRQTRVVKPAGATAVAAVIGCVVVLAYPLLTAKPGLVDADRYWPIDVCARVTEMEFGAKLCPSGLRLVQGEAESEGPVWALSDRGGTLVVRSDAAAPKPVLLRLLVEVHGESRLEIWREDERLLSLYAHPRFQLRAHPRNHPPPNFLVEHCIQAQPGETRLALKLIPWPRPDHQVHATLVDVSVASREELWQRLRSRYLVANTGDTQEQVSLARSLFDKPFLYSYSFKGSVYDGGGYTVSNLPLPYYVYSFALLALGDSLRSLHVLYLAELAAVYLLVCALMRTSLHSGRGWAQIIALLPALAYAVLMRFMIESLYIHTLLTIFLLLAVYFLLRGSRWLLGIALTFALLTKGGIVVVFLLLVGAMVFKPRQGLRVGEAWLAALAALAVAAVCLILVGLGTGSLPSWWALARGTDYGGRYKLLAAALTRFDADALGHLCRAGWDLTVRVLLASCILPVFLVVRRDRVGLWLFAVGAVFHVVVCLSDVVWLRLGCDVHPLNYFAPAGVLLAVAGGRALLLGARARAYIGAAIVGAVCVSACRLYIAGYERHFVPQGAAQREDLTLAVNDYLIRRGVALPQGADALPQALDLAEAYLTEAIRPRAYSDPRTPRLRIQKASALYRLARLWERRGHMAQARRFAQAAVDEWPEYGPANAWLAND